MPEHNRDNQDNRDKIKKYQDEARAEAKCFANLFSSPEGEKVLSMLEAEFYHSPICLPGADSRADSVRGAQMDVISFIHLNIRVGKGEDHGD